MLTFLKLAIDDASAPSRARILSLLVLLLVVNILVWSWSVVTFASRPTLLATALLSYVLGLRHAVDADHIATIDNVVRKLMHDGKHPLAVGLFFSLGHSLSIALAVIAITAATFALQERFQNFRAVGSIVGTGASAFFLLAIAAINLVVVCGLWRTLEKARRGDLVLQGDIDLLLSGSGIMARILRPLFRMITASWQTVTLGLLFGLGFDTATEISLFTVAAEQASDGLSVPAVMIFPALFTAGMTLLDTADSILMVGAYRWAFVNPTQKIWYNLTITAVSVVAALLIGGIEALGLIASKLQPEGSFWLMMSGLSDSLGNAGYLIIGVFIVTWALSFVVYRRLGLDQKSSSL